jgi:hypothetical protein
MNFPTNVCKRAGVMEKAASHPYNIGADLLVILVLIWSAYILVGAISEGRKMEHRQAWIAVGVPVALLIGFRIWQLLGAL